MKRLLMVLGFLIASAVVWGQAAPTANIRVATASTAFGINVPVGYIVYNVATDKLYVCKTATASTATLTTGSANFTEIGTGLPGLTDGYIWVGNGAGAATAVQMSSEATMTNTGAVTLNNGAVIGKVLTGYTSGAGTVAASDNILQAIQKLNGNQAQTAAAVKTAIVEDIEVATADSISGRFYIVPSQTPVSTSLSVSVNGVPLAPTTQYTIVSNKVRIGFNLGLYDKVQLKYSY